MQLDADLTLKKAKKATRQREAVQEQQGNLKGTDTPSVDAIRPERGRRRRLAAPTVAAAEHPIRAEERGSRRRTPNCVYVVGRNRTRATSAQPKA